MRVLTRKERQEQTRAGLLDAAATVFAQRGYTDASVEQIAAEAGYSTGALYSNFGSKEELFLALADREVARRVAEIRAVGDAAREGGDTAQAARQLERLLGSNPDWPLLLNEFRADGVRDAELSEQLRIRRAAVHDALVELLERLAAQRGVQLRHPASMLAPALGAVLNGLAFERATNPGSLPDDVFAEYVAAALACSIAPARRA